MKSSEERAFTIAIGLDVKAYMPAFDLAMLDSVEVGESSIELRTTVAGPLEVMAAYDETLPWSIEGRGRDLAFLQSSYGRANGRGSYTYLFDRGGSDVITVSIHAADQVIGLVQIALRDRTWDKLAEREDRADD